LELQAMKTKRNNKIERNRILII